MKPYTMFLAEEVSFSTFNRINLSGCLVSPEILIQAPPYWLRTHLVLMARFDPAFRGQQLGWGATFVGASPEHSLEGFFSAGTLPDDPAMETLTTAFPLNLELLSEGLLQALVTVGEHRFAWEWRVRTGVAPGKSPTAPPGAAGIFMPGTSPAFNVTDLLRSASGHLSIIDGYLPATDLLALVGQTTADVRVLTFEKQRASYVAERATLAATIPNLEVRFLSKHFHDRFVIVNSDELYTFGHSLKDLGKSVSTFRKVYELTLHQEIVGEFQAGWARSSPL